MSACPLSSPDLSAAAGPADGQRPACHAGLGRLGQDFQRLLRDRMDAGCEQDSRLDWGVGGGIAPKTESASTAHSLCDLRTLVGERHSGGHGGRQEGGAGDGLPRSPAPSQGASPPGCGGRGRLGAHDDDDADESPCPEGRSNEALQRPEPPAWRTTNGLDATSPSTRPGSPAPDPRDLGATRAALEAALATPVSTPDSRSAAAWEVSIPQSSGAPLQLHATRAEASTGAAAWNLGIRSGARDLTSALARTASRLSDRLEARSLPAHVRIERDDEKPQQ